MRKMFSKERLTKKKRERLLIEVLSGMVRTISDLRRRRDGDQNSREGVFLR